MTTFMPADEPGGSAEHPRLIIVGVDDSAEAEAAAKWAVQEADLRKDDVLLVHACEVPLLPSSGRVAAIAQGRQERQALLDRVASTLAVPPRMHLDRRIEVDSPESLLPRLSEKAELTVLGQDHRALSGHMPLGHTASTVASMSRHPVVAVPRRLDGTSGRPSPDSSRHRRAAFLIEHPRLRLHRGEFPARSGAGRALGTTIRAGGGRARHQAQSG
jgi:nucleotide-binding universal stress UspA family protein